MARVAAISWNSGEAEDRAEVLRRAGHEVRAVVPRVGADLRVPRVSPRHLRHRSRAPAVGRSGGGGHASPAEGDAPFFPIVFAGGEAEKVAAVRRLLPDAIYAGWPAIGAALRRALSPRRAAPVVPGTMDAYAGTPLAKRLGIRPAATVALLGRPLDFILGALPQDVTVRDRTAGKPDVIVPFAPSLAELERRPRG